MAESGIAPFSWFGKIAYRENGGMSRKQMQPPHDYQSPSGRVIVK
jgi:hypothetical protein